MAKAKEKRNNGSLPRKNTEKCKPGRWKLEVKIWKGPRQEGGSDYYQTGYFSACDPKHAKIRALQEIQRQVRIADTFLDCDGKLRIDANFNFASKNGNNVHPNSFCLKPNFTYYSICFSKRPAAVFQIRKPCSGENGNGGNCH